MKNRALISVAIFSLFCLLIIPFIPQTLTHAQTREKFPFFDRNQAEFDRLSTDEKIKRFEGLSSEQKMDLFKSLSDEDKVLIFENLGDVDKQNIFKGLSDEDKAWIFENLSDADKEKIFRSLSDADKQKIFKDLSGADKRRLFRTLSDAERQEIYANLSKIEQRRLLKTLSDADKRKIFDTLSRTEKEEWLRRYPELERIITPEEILPIPPRVAEAPSDIEKIMSGEFPTRISLELRQFGYDFFAKEISTFTPVTNIPVGPDYIIGPGDGFTIHLWGKAEGMYDVNVTRDGTITVLRLGTMNVSGLTFVELKSYLFHKFREYYPDFEMSITMGPLRSIEVFIVGDAENPGTYSVSSLSTIITALFASGGPSKNGSLRNIKLFRNGELIKSLDLYEFFIKGTKVNDVRLQLGDTIFIPAIGPIVGVAGLVKRPAIYEFRERQTIGDALELAGGVLPVGHLQNVVIERIRGHRRRVIRSFNLDPTHPGTNENLKMPLNDFDLIKVHPVHKMLRKVVYLQGHVKYPREYELKPGMRLRDIIPSYDSLLPEPYLPQAEIIRLTPPDLHPEIIEFNLSALLSGDEEQNLLLQDQDSVRIYDRWEKREIPEVTIGGAVRSPGTYRLYQGMTVKDLIFQAGNLIPEAYLQKASLRRIVPGEPETDTIKMDFSPQKAIEGEPQDNILLQDDDQVYIREIPRYREALGRKAVLEGEFLFPGEYTFSEGERLHSIIERAGGLTEEAYLLGAVFQRESVKKIQQERLKDYITKLEQDILTMTALSAEAAVDKEQAAVLQQSLSAKRQLLEKLKTAEPTGRMVIDLPEVLVEPTSDYNFELRPGDRLIVDKRPDNVNVLGEVYNPTALFAERGKSVGYYLNRVGGITDMAEEDQMYLVKADGSVISKSQEGFFGQISWESKKHTWTMRGFESIELNPGDTVIVPRKVEKYPWLRVTKDITQVMYQIAVAAGVIIVAF